MLTGDRRWAPGRKLTVLGKVPKPINLPSQRLENRRLDPSVEIVPKGTITWGSKPSVASPNAWGASPLLSPKTDGSSGSPTNIRPSSAEAGLRPSTACSDVSQESASSAGGANSRPSSASGIFSSQTSSPANRPRSAETRPGSSQLSRFAENYSESTNVWGSSTAGERVAPPSTRTSGFTLSSRDFPTLGTEKTYEPDISKGVTEVDMAPRDSNSWNKDDQSPLDFSTSPRKEGLQFDIPEVLPCSSANMPPYQFDAYHGPPVCSPDSVSQAGGPVCGPFRLPERPPGCYPLEAFGYYPPGSAQFANSQPVASSGHAPSYYYTPNLDMFQTHLQSHSFMVANIPVMPVRAGFYQGPASKDAHYAPQRSFPNFTDSEGTSKGMTAAPGVYSQHHTNPGKVSASLGLNSSVVLKDLIISDRVASSEGQYKILLKQHDGSKDSDQGKKEEFSTDNQSFFVGDQHEVNTQNVEWEADDEEDARTTSMKSLPSKVSTVYSSNWIGKSSEPVDLKVSSDFRKSSNEEGMKLPETSSNATLDKPRQPVTKKNTALIEKNEGLNNKACMADVQGGNGPVVFREKLKHSKVVKEVDGSLPTSSTKIDPCEQDRNNHSQVHRIDHSLSRNDYGSEQRLNKPIHERKMKASSRIPPVVGTIRDSEHGIDNDKIDPHSSLEINEEFHCTRNSYGSAESATSTVDADDCKAQRAKFRVRAAQRGEQLRQEEEERVREQKARALAKLAELDRRTAVQCLNQDSGSDPSASIDFQVKEDSEICSTLKMDTISDRIPCDNSNGSSEVIEPRDGDQANSLNDRSQILNSGDDSAVAIDQSLPPNKDSFIIKDNIVGRDFSDGRNLVIHEQMCYRRHNIVQEKRLTETAECLINSENMGNPKNSGEESNRNVDGADLLSSKEPLFQNKKKNKKARNKNKFSHGAPSRNLPSERDSESNQGMVPSDKGNPMPELLEPVLPTPQAYQETVVGKCSSSDGDTYPAETFPIACNEQQSGRFGSHWKPQPSKRSVRSRQTQRPGDNFQGNEAVVWAPVKPQCKNNPSGVIQINISETTSSCTGSNGQTQNACTKIKRADIERYVPKSAAREISHASSTMNRASPADATREADLVGSRIPESEMPAVDIPASIAEPAAQMKTGDHNKSNRHGRIHTSWRQRNPLASQNTGEVDTASEAANPYEWPPDQYQEPKSKTVDLLNQHGSKVSIEKPAPSEPVTVSFHEDQGVASRHRHQRYKVQRGVGFGTQLAPNDSQRRPSNKNGADTLAISEASEGEREVLGVDNRKPGNREHKRAHWQPKSQAHACDAQGEGRSGGAQSFVPRSGRFGQGLSAQISEDSVHGNQDTDISFRRIHDIDASNASNPDGDREASVSVGAVNKQAPPENKSAEAGLAPPGAVSYRRHQHGSLLATQRRGQQNYWVDKRRDAGGKKNLPSGDNNKGRENAPHYEYQPIDKPSDSQLRPANDVDALGGGTVQPPRPRHREQLVQNPLRCGDRS